jgi:GT2 family glycosyltransferase
MPAEPAVSVVMAFYNKEPHVARAIQSVLIQTYRDFELIADSGPTEGVHSHPRQDLGEHALNYDWSRIVSQTASVCELSCG